MIIVCEPQCKAFSHEKVNSGFLRALRLAFPQEPIRAYAHSTHIQTLKDVLRLDSVEIDNIEFVPIEFEVGLSVRGLVEHRRTFRMIFDAAVANGTERVLFLSYSAPLLFVIKALLARQEYRSIHCAMVLHGEFEDIADDRIASSVAPAPVPSVITKAKALRMSQVPRSAWRYVRGRVASGWSRMAGATLLRLFPLRRMLYWRRGPRVRYIALSEHIVRNAHRYVDVDALGIRTVVMPITYAPIHPAPGNAIARFAIFGYGDSAMLHAVLSRLAQRLPPEAPFEVRIIGMDDRGTEGFRHVTTPSKGVPLDRARMEALALDIDMFLSLYTSERYRLSCSGSIFEAISNVKPMLHFRNECIDAYDRPGEPIGFRAEDIEDYAAEMAKIVTDYPAFLERAAEYRANLLRLREEHSMDRAAASLREALTWKQS